MDSDLLKRLILVAFIGVVLVGVYFVTSPYQNCLRAFNAEVSSVSLQQKGRCLDNTSW